MLGVGLLSVAAMAQQDIAVKQDNLMRAQGKSLYGVIGKMMRIPGIKHAVKSFAAIAKNRSI